MTATIIRPARFKGPPIRCVDAFDEALSLLRIAELRAGVVAAEATAADLERLRAAVEDVIAGVKGGVL